MNKPVSGIYNLGSGRAQTFNDVALTVINTMRGKAGKAPITLDTAVTQGLIEYIPFPDGLKDKYQAFTQADLTQLRAAGCDIEFRSVEQGTASYIHWLIENT